MKNGKTIVLKLVGLMLIGLGCYMVYEHLIDKTGETRILNGMGAVIAGLAVLILSRNKTISG